jgi:hypothetical protein
LFGCCSRSEITSAESANAIATIPNASHRVGVTAAMMAPSATQLSADSAVAALSPARPPRSAQASAKAAGTSRTSKGRAPCISHPRASAANSGTATSAIYVSAVALAVSAALPIATNPITDIAGIKAHQPLCNACKRSGAHRRGSATTAPWHTDRTPIETQNGGIQSK